MHGRDKELERLRAFVDGARDGRSGVVLVHGDAGVGKSTLLEAIAAEAAASGCTVLRASGIASESTVAWSGLADLCRPITRHVPALPEPQRDALAGALALGRPIEGDRFAVGIATLGLLAAAATVAPVVAVVDDAQWLDAASVGALLFAGRRLDAEGVVMVLAVRDGVENPHDLSWPGRLAVGALSPAATWAVLQGHAPQPIAPEVADRLLAAAAGNALAAVELPRLLTAEQLAGRSPLPEPLPVPASLERALTERLRSLPETSRRALTVAGAHGGGSIEPVAAALATLGLALTDLEPAEAAGALRLGDGRITFAHPLLRSAAYQAAAPHERRAAHAALADVLRDDPWLEARARHLASASIGVDEMVASCLEAAAGQASAAGALSIAADLSRKASMLSPTPGSRARRGLAAADLALLSGGTRQAIAYLDELGPLEDPALRIGAAQIRGRWHVLTGGHRAGVDALIEAGDATAQADPSGAAQLFVQAAAISLSGGRHERAAELAQRAVGLAREDGPVALLASVAEAATRVVVGDAEGGARLVTLYEGLGDDDELLELAQPILLAVVAALIWLEDFDRAEALVDTVVRSARRRRAIGVLPLALIHRAWILVRRPKVAAAEAAATEALELADATGQASVALWAQQMLAHIVAQAGRYDEARRLATHVRDVTDDRSLTALRYNATMALARVEMADGRHDMAIELLEEIVDPEASSPFFRNPAAFGAAFHLIESLIRVGREADARALLERTEEATLPLRQPWPRGQVVRMRGLLEEGYDELFAEAIALLGPTGNALIWARVDWAARLREDGRDDEARRQLHAAFAVARRTGYHGRTARIVADLAALGEPVLAAPDALGRLSGQELAVATTIAGGASVPEAAVELFLSPQTIERDLLEVCRKLGVTSLDDLAQRLAGKTGDGRATESGWFVTVLGPCRVQRDGVDVPVPAGRAGTLLQLLATIGGAAPIDEVIEHLWPEVDPEVGRVRIRNVLARLRRRVGDIVGRDGELLALADGVGIDAGRFLAEADAALALALDDVEQAAKLGAVALRWYSGSLLPEARYEPWAAGPRDRLHRRYVQLLDLLADHSRRHRRWDDAARYLELGIEAEPYDHDRYVSAAEVRLLQGRRSSALHLVRRARERAEELDVPLPLVLADLELSASA